MWEKETPARHWWERKSTAILETSVEVPKGDQIKHPYDPTVGPNPKAVNSGWPSQAHDSTFHKL